MNIKFFSINSENCKNIYIGFTSKASIYKVFEQYKCFYTQYVNKTTTTKRKYFPIFEQGEPYIVLLGECEIYSNEELYKTLREIKILHQENCINFKEIYHENIDNTVRKYKKYSVKKKDKVEKSPTSENNTVIKIIGEEMDISFNFPVQNIKIIT
jgi:hypothetical protein